MNIDLLIKIARVNPNFITDEMIEVIKQRDIPRELIIIANVIGKFDLIPNEVDGYLNLEEMKLTSLGQLTCVNSDLNLYGTKIASLDKLNFVGGNLCLRFTKITDIGDLEFVGVSLDLCETNVTSLDKLRHVGLDLDIRTTDITSLGQLRYVGGNVFCDNRDQLNLIKQNHPQFKDKLEFRS